MGHPNPTVKAKQFIDRYKTRDQALTQVKQIIAMAPFGDTYWSKVIQIIESHDY